ncbi:MAG: hypothetical protein H6657_25115 [Ardenticatenaceae bacterium]|nr:hypothetical protein [Ardenticatenaceae bacterium]
MITDSAAYLAKLRQLPTQYLNRAEISTLRLQSNREHESVAGRKIVSNSGIVGGLVKGRQFNRPLRPSQNNAYMLPSSQYRWILN